jgi:alkylhydroperoxidase/carboxymuconolactone decarboxylase family protein YurZ
MATDIKGGHLDVFAIHIKFGLECSLSPDEIREAIWHGGPYCDAQLTRGARRVALEALGDE